MWAWIHCWMRSHHDPVRHPLGGFRCRDCGAMGLDLGEMGFRELDTASRRPARLFSREERARWNR